MRLKTIKLAGFKSFVDPTSVDFLSNMCAVVGPNGCGKSNIIDAVRWVMGESSAKNLRGEAMTDVIFNGSGSRKPVGQASIELIFDNSDATITGEYAGYAEISIKRRVTRDAQNLYYLNGNRCRRRDITDIFLGTGLGPRSYAIIEQGMISRLIEAKPEDLRVYIEEAAGISKYKERRKDTENRMRRTQENLERLTDIRDELERQLARLERQAKAAEKYGELKKAERGLNAKLRAIRYQVLKQSADTLTRRITDAELGVEGAITQRVRFDTEIERHRSEFSDRSDRFNEVQGQFYSLGTDIARIEQSIKHTQERERALRIDLEQTERDCRESEQHLALDNGKIEGWEAELLEITPELALLEQSVEESNLALAASEEGMQAWQQEWDAFNQRAAEPKQKAEVQQSRIQYLEQVQQRLHQRKQKIEQEHTEMPVGEDESDIALLEEELSERELESEEKAEASTLNGKRINALRNELTALAESRQKKLGELQSRRGRLASLEALQAAALGKENNKNARWLEDNGLQIDDCLAQNITVEPEWETALEVVLGDALQAIVTDRPVTAFIDRLSGLASSVDVLSSANSSHVSSGLTTLLSKITCEYDVSAWLGGVAVAEDLNEARTLLNQLTDGDSVVTKDGIWLSNQWIRVRKQSDSQAGVIARRHEIDQLSALNDSETRECDALAEHISQATASLEQAEAEREQISRELEQHRRQANEYRAQLVNKKSNMEQMRQRQQRAEQDIAEISTQLIQESENLAEARAILEEAIDAMEGDSDEREKLLNRRDALRGALDEARQKARHSQDRNHELAMRNRSAQAQLDSMKSGIVRLQEQIARMQERREHLRLSLEESTTPVEEHALALEALLEKRSAVEQKLSDARKDMDETESALRSAEKSRNQIEQDLSVQRGKLEEARLELKTLDVQAQNIQEQLDDDAFNLDTVLQSLTEDDNEQDLIAQIADIERGISRLGAINLAAIDEYKTEAERKLYLDEQNQDLCEALETLEGAIRKIDKETRTRFSETYEQVNSGLQELFPKLFGGGHAYLELTGEDMLDTGIAIMARPPGKKNSTIHLLSGGEKALTAIALVFSIFQLNPAPFCMLDEVDAPLDDANVGRYANMVEAMSEKVQFIYITHNKIAMEKALHLMGVTMQEAGVSRMVTVDVEEAAELAAL